jgi:hypothetical protein
MSGPTLRSRSASLRIAGRWGAGRDGAYRGPLEYSMLTCRVPGLAVLVIRGDHDAQAKHQRTYPAIATEA